MQNITTEKGQAQRPFRILLIGPTDEVGGLAASAHQVLQDLDLEALVAWDLASAIQMLDSFQPHGVVLTWSALSSAPPEMLLDFRERIPQVGMVAIAPDEGTGAKSFWLGADDFLLPAEVSWRALKRVLRSSQLQRQFMQDANQQRSMLSMALNVAHAGNWWFDVFVNDNGEAAWADEAYLSPAMKALIGYEDHEMPNSISAWMNRVHPDDRPVMKGAVFHHLKSGTPASHVEYRIQHKDGHWLQFLSRGKLLRDGLGRPTRWMGVVMDITSVYQAQQGQAHFSELTSALLRHSPDAVYLFALDSCFLAVNEAGAKRFGTEPNLLIGRYMWDLIPPELVTSRKAALQEIIATGTPRILHDNRVGVPCDSIVFPIPNAQGIIDRFGVIVREFAPTLP